jgi:phage terminase large subunit-like protein
VKGDLAGQPFLLEEWQKEYIHKMFGTMNENGQRQYRTSYVQIPRKNGKSNLLAAVALAMLFVEKEARCGNLLLRIITRSSKAIFRCV